MWKDGIKVKRNISVVHALKACEAPEVELHAFLTSRLCFLSGQLHVPTLGTGNCVKPNAGLDDLQKRKRLLPLPG
jgi:hypothetical protein